MVNKKDEPCSSAKKKHGLSSSRSSSVEKQHGSSAATGVMGSPGYNKSGNSPSTSQGLKKLGSAPKSHESPLKQALVIHHANVQQISVK